MDPDISIAFIVYVTIFRLAMIAAAIVSIVLGYQLFCKGVWPESGGGGGQGSTVSATIAGHSFTLKNAAPGTCFALFGVMIITVMFATSPPELSRKTVGTGSPGIEETPGTPTEHPAAQPTTVTEFTLRGSSDELNKQLMEAAVAYQSGDFTGADDLYDTIRTELKDAGDAVALLHNELASRYLEEERNDEAIKHSRTAIGLRPEDSDYVDTFVYVICKMQDPESALEELRNLDESNSNELVERRKSLRDGRCLL